MLNTLKIYQTSAATPGDNLGGHQGREHNGFSPWVESDTIGAVNILGVSPKDGIPVRCAIECDGSDNYAMIGTVAHSQEWEVPGTLGAYIEFSSSTPIDAAARIVFVAAINLDDILFETVRDDGVSYIFGLNGPISVGQTVIFDGRNMTVTLDGIPMVQGTGGGGADNTWWIGDFPVTIFPDTTRLEFGGYTGVDSPGTATIDWLEYVREWVECKQGGVAFLDDTQGNTATITVDKDTAPIGLLTYSVIRDLNLTEREISAVDPQYRCFRFVCEEALTLDEAVITGALGGVSAITNGVTVTSDGTTEPTVDGWAASYESPFVFSAGAEIAAWVQIPTTATPGKVDVTVVLNYHTDADVGQACVSFSGLQYDETLEGYKVYSDPTATIDGTPGDVFAELPYTEDITGAATAGNYRVAACNKYGLETECRWLGIPVDVDSAGNDLIVPPVPTDLTLTDIGGGIVRVQANWLPQRQWRLAYKWHVLSGSTVYDVPASAISQDGYYRLDYALPAASWGDILTVSASITSRDKTSAYTAPQTITVTSSNPGIGPVISNSGSVSTGGLATGTDYKIFHQPGSVTVTGADGTLLWTVSETGGLRTLYFGGRTPQVNAFDYLTEGIAPIVKLSAYYNLRSYPGWIGATLYSTHIWCAAFEYNAETIDLGNPSEGPVHVTASATYWNVFDPVLGRWVSYMKIEHAKMTFGCPLI